MKLSVNWLKEFVDINLSIDELVTKIGAQLGAVEEVVDLSKKYQGIVVAQVMECVKHPNADKLSLCKIDDGKKVKNVKRDKNGLVQVVCGAPNVKAGMLVAWLPPGATVPASYDKDPFVLEARELRGKVSNGMIASASELDLSDDHNGIVELTWGKPGDDFAKTYGLDDYVIDVENKMFTHRPDCFGIVGVAREIAGITGQQFKSPDMFVEKPKRTVKGTLALAVDNKIPKLVPRFMAQVVEGVNVKSSPVWMQAYLARVGIRSINNIVDVTNYAMYLTAQPLHAYDYDKLCKIAGTKTAQLETRLSKKGDKLKLLNGKELKLGDDEAILITSNNVPVGVGGVMGGADTEVDETTTSIVLECANFDMYAIRRASMRHGLFTDAVTRFNKGQSALQNPSILSKAADWTVQLAGGKLGKLVDQHGKLAQPIAVHVTPQFINDRLGLNLSLKDIRKLLENVEFKTTTNGPTLVATPPFWRTDIEIPEDIVEEVGRLYGYDHLPLELPKRSVKPPAKNSTLELKKQIRAVLSAAGANELLTYNFVHGDLFGSVGQNAKHAYKLSNALSPDLQYYRTSLTPSLLDKVHMNVKAGHDKFAIFEMNKVHYTDEMDDSEPGVPNEDNHLSLVFAADKSTPQGAAFYQARNYLARIAPAVAASLSPMSEFNLASDEWGKQLTTPYDPERSALIVKDKQIWGVVGEYRASVKRALKLPNYTAGFEINLGIFEGQQQTAYQQLSRYPRAWQDITLKVPSDLNYRKFQEFLDSHLEADEHTHATLEPVGIYQGKDKSTKNITMRLTIVSYERTLKNEAVNGLLDKLAAKAKKTLRAERI